jgi:undecaprenyl-phosphate 4-deoxy-4-formamido-L-arabinose transferase
MGLEVETSGKSETRKLFPYIDKSDLSSYLALRATKLASVHAAPSQCVTENMDPQETNHRGSAGAVGLSIVIPLYRDEDALAQIFQRCEPVLDEQPDGGELVLVDDGGRDRTTPVALGLAQRFPHPTIIVRLARNFGQHTAIFAGLKHASGKRVVTLDSDLQYPPEEIYKLLRELGPDYPVVSGYRAARRDPAMRRLITRVLTQWLNAQTQTQLRDFGSMFRAYDRQTVDLMLSFTERHRYVPAIVAWLGVPIKEVPIVHAARGSQGTRYRLSTLIAMTFDLITGYSVFPLRLLTVAGIIASAGGCIGAASFIVYRISVGTGVSGTVSAFALVFALLTVLLLLVAMIGEYVGRIYNEAKARPYFVVGSIHRTHGDRSSGTADWQDDTDELGVIRRAKP